MIRELEILPIMFSLVAQIYCRMGFSPSFPAGLVITHTGQGKSKESEDKWLPVLRTVPQPKQW